MKQIKDYYFKQLYGEPVLMSGANLPHQDLGPYEFVNCHFHPRLWEALQQMYRSSTFLGCNWAPNIWEGMPQTNSEV